MQTYLVDMLECPACHGDLDWIISEKTKTRIGTAEAHCKTCDAAYPVREGIGLFLTPDLPRNDLWEQMQSGLSLHLQENPKLERQLMEPSLDSLAPADRFFRALECEERGNYSEAQIAEHSANKDLYTPAYLNCWNSQMDYVIEQLSVGDGPIVDLASGRCYLVEKMLHNLKRPVVATDFSPGILRKSRRKLKHFGLDGRVSMISFDARRTPFKDGSVDTLTTNLGLPNIEDPGKLLKELRRITRGNLLAISHFFPEDDEANARVIRDAGLEMLLHRRTALEQFDDSGWDVEVKNACVGDARPTPPSVVFDGTRPDGLPVEETTLEWCVLFGS